MTPLPTRTAPLDHKALTKHIRGRIAHAGIPARVKMNDANGWRIVSVIVPTFDARWSAEQIDQIAIIAQVNHLTLAQGMSIDREIMRQLTEAHQFNFYLPVESRS